MKQIYLDHNATTPIDPAVIEVMAETARRFWANPSSGHSQGLAAREELERGRTFVARFIGAEPSEVVFTAGGTESDNLALIGAARANQKKGKHFLVSSIEHHAVLASCEILRDDGFEIDFLPVDRYGRVDPEDVKKRIRNDTILVSVMHANNEVGTIQPVSEIGRIVKERGVLFHSDAAQSLGKIPVKVDELSVDLLTCSSHKIYGPKGLGFLYVRKGTRLSPLIVGGGQEGGIRSGTENLPGISGLAKAFEIAKLDEEAPLLSRLRDSLFEELSHSLDGLHLNGHPGERLPGTLSFSIEGVLNSELLKMLYEQGISLSASAACATGSIKSSHVLSAMGIPLEQAAGTLRISFGRLNKDEEIPQIVESISSSVNRLRKDRS